MADPPAAIKTEAAVASLLLASAAAAASDSGKREGKCEEEARKLLHQQLNKELQLQSEKKHPPRSILIFCTGNEHKLREAQMILGEQEALLLSADLNLFELQSISQEAIAEAKCKEALYKLQVQWRLLQEKQRAEAAPKPLVFTEDTCLCYDALGGMPGAYVKWFLARAGPEGLCKMLHGFEKRDAYALCTLCVVELDDIVAADGQLKRVDVKIFQGRTKGTIAREPRGPRTFGWDCIFQPDGHDKTFAELDAEEKNLISHRFKAMDQLRDYIRKRNENLKGDQ